MRKNLSTSNILKLKAMVCLPCKSFPASPYASLSNREIWANNIYMIKSNVLIKFLRDLQRTEATTQRCSWENTF